MTFVTNRLNSDKVLQLLEDETEDLLSPVMVMTIEDINGFIRDEADDDVLEERLWIDNVVIPGLWQKSLTSDYLENHNRNLEDDLERIRNERTEVERKWVAIIGLMKRVERFFDEFPYDEYTGFTNRKTLVSQELKVLEKELDELDSSEKERRLLLADHINELSLRNEEASSVKEKVELARRHEAVYDRYLADREEEEAARGRLADLIYERKEMEISIRAAEAEMDSSRQGLGEFSFEERRIMENPQYIEVADADPICSNVDIKVC